VTRKGIVGFRDSLRIALTATEPRRRAA
jgi:hypothetical protein